MRFRASPALLGVLVTAALTSSGCDLVNRYVSGSPEDQLVAAAVARWASTGIPFLDGVSGQDTVASVTPTGARSWEVGVVPPAGGTPTIWSMEIPEAEVYPVVPNADFASWLESQARDKGLRTFLPPEVTSALKSGQIQAVGRLQVRYGPADRSGRNTDEHIAYLTPVPGSEDVEWQMQPSNRSSAVLLQALQLVVGDMVRTDDRVLSCMGSASPAGVPRARQLKCVGDVFRQQFEKK